MKNKRFIILLAIALTLLLIPFVAMQFTNEVDWDIFDFILMGILLVASASICELVIRKEKKMTYKILICGIVLFVFFLIWVELAVGVFGTPNAGS